MSLYYPNPELVTVGWIKTVPGIPTDIVATTIPSVDNDNFHDHGFVQVTAVGGTPNQDTFMQNSTVQIDTWAFNRNSTKVPWGKAFNLAMLLKEGLKDAARDIITPNQYHNAHVHEVRVLIDPRRMSGDFPGDEAHFARYSFDIQVHWSLRELVS